MGRREAVKKIARSEIFAPERCLKGKFHLREVRIPRRVLSHRKSGGLSYVMNRKRQEPLTGIVVVLLTFFIIVCGSLLGSTIIAASQSEASEESPSFKYYTCIEIQPGDTLWSIALKYVSSEYDSVYDYIEELKALNQLGPDEIHAGQYLTVPYYSQVFQ